MAKSGIMETRGRSTLELHLLRHGKSSWEDTHLSDADRPLTEQGIESACIMAKRFFSGTLLPDLILVSPAVRALHTAMIFIRYCHLPASIVHISEAIYNSDDESVLELISF